MRIKEIRIRNYRSLQDFVMEDIGSLSTLIGSNSSGKSNLFEAILIFLNGLDPSLERTIGTADEYLWFDRDSRKDIVFQIGFEIEKEELNAIIPEEVVPDIRSSSASYIVTIVRVIKGPYNSAKWKTLEISFNGNKLIKDDKFVYKRKEKVKKEESKAPGNQKATPPPTDYLGVILQNISKYFRGKFKLILAVRNESSQGDITKRTSLISSTLIGELVKLGQTIGTRPDETTWIATQESVKNTSLDIEDLRIMSGQVTRKGERYVLSSLSNWRWLSGNVGTNL